MAEGSEEKWGKKYLKVASYEGIKGKVKKVLLLYSGGLDSSVMIPWLKEHYDCEVVTLTVNLGQFMDDMEEIKRRALSLGAKDAIVVDMTEEFVKRCIFKAIKANGQYDGYYLSTPLGRVLTCEVAVKVAADVGADAIGHGCTGKGNDQVRFDGGVLTLAPWMKIVAPVREWGMGREEEYEYAMEHGIDAGKLKRCPYSHDDNIWGITSEGKEIEEPGVSPPFEKILRVCSTPQNAPDESVDVKVGFEEGVPVSVDGVPMKEVELIRTLNRLGALHGVGVTVLIEDRIVGLKVRGVYESPAAHILITAHKALEALVLSKEELFFKKGVEAKWAQMVYDGKWFEPLREALDAFIQCTQRWVTGTVTLNLYKGACRATAVESPYSLCDVSLATFERERVFNKNASAPFIELYSLQMRTVNKVRQNGSE
ncbi:MAG: argininosuccinate synthase [Planctomycetota bacterium]|nr:argininosuccinate synthase [Planctomycetota bacterium]